MNRLLLRCKGLACLRSLNYENQRYFKRWVAPTHKAITARKKKLGPQPEPKRSNFIEWNRDAELYAFNQRLSENFDHEKLEQAFTHKSYIFEEEKRQKDMGIEDPKLSIQHNEELISEGRRLVSKIIIQYLNTFLPRVPEPGIIAFHDYLISTEILAKASFHIGTKDIILSSEYPVSEETLADTFLALVAALAESTDESHASNFVKDFLIVALGEKDLTEIWCPSEPLEVLNNILVKDNRAPVEPRIIAKTGQSTLLAAYQIAVYTNKQFLGSGCGETIQEAQNTAATDALCRMFGLLDSSQPLRFNVKINTT